MTIAELREPRRQGRPSGERLLDVRDLHTSFKTSDGVVRAVDGVDFHVDRGEILGLVGESGCGKSVTSLSLMGLVGEARQGRRGARSSSTGRTCSRCRRRSCGRCAATGSA